MEILSGTTFWILWWIFVFLVVFNFVPTVIAVIQRHPERRLIAGLNIVSLFSFALWLGLMAWVLGGKRDDSAINRFVSNRQNRRLVIASTIGMVMLGFSSTLYGLDLI